MASRNMLTEPPPDVSLYNRLVGALHAAHQAIDPWAYITPQDVAGILPGGGFPQAWQESGAARDALYAGNYGQAAGHYGNMLLNLIPEGGAIGGKLAAAMAPGIRAFHGSPHDFDKFDLSKIGTGEGNQSYGHGLYFAENEKVAKGYRDNLAKGMPTVEGRAVDPTNPEHIAATYAAQHRSTQEAVKALDEDMAWAAANPQFAPPQQHLEAAAKARDVLASGKPLPPVGENPGHMYEVNIAADPNHFLDWDKPPSQQPQNVRDAFAAIGVNPPDKHLWMNEAANQLAAKDGSWSEAAGARNVTKKLAEQGVPGIKYLDQGSRAAGDGSRNYVVFDDKLISILKKYGWVPGAAIPAAAMLEYHKAGGSEPQT